MLEESELWADELALELDALLADVLLEDEDPPELDEDEEELCEPCSP